MAPVDAPAIRVSLPDGSTRELPTGTTGMALAESIGARLAKASVAVAVNDVLWDLSRPLPDGAAVALVTEKDPRALEVLRHSAAHLMAMAVQKLIPGTMVTIGPVTEDGFFYDFDAPRPITAEELGAIEAEMQRLAKADLPITRTEVPPAEAKGLADRFRGEGEPYKAEILEDILDLDHEATITLYGHGGWSDLCRGPHLPSTGKIQHVKLLKVAGAYWKGSEKNKMLQRIYGTAYFTKEDLAEHMRRLEEAAKRDHRRIGQEQDLFSIPEVTGPGLIFWHPKGALIRSVLEDWLRAELRARGYEQVYTPHVVKETLFEVSGHLGNYADNMYPAMDVEGANYRLKPMNCPGHSMIYKSRLRSYRDLPVRLQEIASVYRFERSGTLHGLARVRGLSMDDAHIFCTLEQLPDEITGCVQFIQMALETFGLSCKVYLSTKPEKAIGDDEVWERATHALSEALKRTGLDHDLDVGGGAFYGPKIDFKFYDAIGREWQGPTVQCDFNLPERFDLSYRGADGQEHRPVMVHRAILGTFERFFALLIEHFAGAFPLWLSPTQAVVIPINDEAHAYGEEVLAALKAAGLRAELDDRNESLNYRIREAQVQKVPYMLVLGGKEVEARTVAVRHRAGGRQIVLPLDGVVAGLKAEHEGRKLESQLLPAAPPPEA